MTLSDGSTVTLNTDTAISVTFTTDERNVSLLKGEAYFDVTHQSNRPFTVAGNVSTTRVVGTRFLVKVMPDEEKVTVLKGLVQVNSQHQQALLHPNEQVQTTPVGLSPIQTQIDNREAAWLNGHLAYHDQTLSQVVKELDRYIPGWVVVTGDNLKGYRISGRFNIAQPQNALDTLAYTLPVNVAHIGPWLTVIRPK
ncbi:MAG: FecR domain-containing protein [Methylococcaceae bacterium]|nr:FecR domain-containing protein [Methylococcaceae bacterium]